MEFLAPMTLYYMPERRKSYMEPEEVYFVTATIRNWYPLLTDDLKDVIMESLGFLKRKALINLYGYVIMPNHFHLLWSWHGKNGKESPIGSLLKYTAHEFKYYLKHDPGFLRKFHVNRSNKRYEFWQRDSLAIPISGLRIAEQKLDYIHANPMQEHWQLSKTPEDYPYSSASFYELGQDRYGIMTHYLEVFG